MLFNLHPRVNKLLFIFHSWCLVQLPSEKTNQYLSPYSPVLFNFVMRRAGIVKVMMTLSCNSKRNPSPVQNIKENKQNSQCVEASLLDPR